MSEQSEKATSPSPTDSLTRPSELIPPGSPIRFIDICNVARRITSQEEEGEEEAGCEGNQTGEGGAVVCSPIPDCLTPTLEDHALSQMLVSVADQDNSYVGGEMLSPLSGTQSTSQGTVPTLAGQTPSPVDCLSPFWYGDDISRDGPGGDKVASPKGKKAPMTLGIADKRFFVINNGRVAEDGGAVGTLSGGATKTCVRYYHEGAVMELIPGQTPAMKPVEGKDDVDAGSAMTEYLQKGPVSTVEEAWVESGFCAILVLFYEDPENPRLEALNKPKLLEKLADLKKRKLTPSAEHFTPLVNISREQDSNSEEYNIALYFTTKEYTYYIYVDKTNLTLKKYKTGDTDPSANPRNNKQFLDKQDQERCSQCAMCSATKDTNGVKGREETDSSGTTGLNSEEKEPSSGKVSSGVDSADVSSNSASSNSSQLSSPEGLGSSSINPPTSKVLNDSGNQDSGVEAN